MNRIESRATRWSEDVRDSDGGAAAVARVREEAIGVGVEEKDEEDD